MNKTPETAAGQAAEYLDFHAHLPVQDDRTRITVAEASAIEEKYIKADGSLLRIPRKEKEKLVLLRRLSGRFEAGKKYTQKEVDAILIQAHEDYAALRRYLIDYRFMRREPDGSAYWIDEGDAVSGCSSAGSD
jgi:hypothetical protein